MFDEMKPAVSNIFYQTQFSKIKFQNRKLIFKHGQTLSAYRFNLFQNTITFFS